MKVCVTGATGFIGSYAAASLVGAGHSLRLLVRDRARATALLERRGVPADSCELVPGDMVDAASVETAVAGCDATIHAAAAVGMTGRGAAVYEANTAGARNVLRAAAAAGHDPIVHLSSVAVFVPPHDPVITPDSPLASPRSEYGRSKVDAERTARGLQGGGAAVTILYPGGVIGPDQPSFDSTIEGIAGARRQGWPKTTGGVCLLDVRDLAAAIGATMEPGRGARRLMLGGRFFAWAELGALIDGLTGVRARRVPLPPPVITRFGSFLDVVRRVRPVRYPLTRDAAEIMTTMVPTHDTPTLESLGLTLRPVEDTLEDTIRWLSESGHLAAKHAGALAS